MVSMFTQPDVNTWEVGRTQDKRGKPRSEAEWFPAYQHFFNVAQLLDSWYPTCLTGFALACNGFLLCVLHCLPLYKKCIKNSGWIINNLLMIWCVVLLSIFTKYGTTHHISIKNSLPLAQKYTQTFVYLYQLRT